MSARPQLLRSLRTISAAVPGTNPAFGLPMNKRALILVATDLSKPGNFAVTYAAGLAARLGARLLIVHVFDGLYAMPRELLRPCTADDIATRRAECMAALHHLAATVAQPGLRIECLAVHGAVRDELPKLATARQAAMLVMGSHGQGVANPYFLGSVADCVARSSPVPVLIVRGETTPWKAAAPATTRAAVD